MIRTLTSLVILASLGFGLAVYADSQRPLPKTSGTFSSTAYQLPPGKAPARS